DAILTLDIPKLAQSFLPIILLISVYFGHKLIHKTKVIPLDQIDLSEHEMYTQHK
ncbi:gamma-aminobutyrate permease, partial [Staphylococcus chromogenes]|nr:gamma-aminobutyrate permease [Staphylococcus chromogenes]